MGYLAAMAVLISLTSCIAAMPDPMLRAVGDPQGRDVKRPVLVPVDQPLGPPVSRAHSAVLDRALTANSNAAIIMFLLKNPGDPFSAMARENLKGRTIPDSAAQLQKAAGVDAPLVAAFDAARLSGTDAAWAEFLTRYGDTPLTAEVAFFR